MSQRRQRSDARPFGDRFWERVEKGDECWEWTGGCSGTGYGFVVYSGVGYSAHHVAYVLAEGEVPAGREIHHVCGNKRCVRPSHLAAVTRSEHIRLHVGDYCKNGHPFENRTSGTGRECRVCRAARQQANRERRNAQQRERRRKQRALA